jgi:hypothetical protein
LKATKSSIGSFSEPRTVWEGNAGVGVADEQVGGGEGEVLALIDEQRCDQRAARNVLKLDRLVPTPRRDAVDVRRERDRPYKVGMPFEGWQRAAQSLRTIRSLARLARANEA